MTHGGVERQLVIELLAQRPAGPWDVYEHLARTYDRLDPEEGFDPGDNSADFCHVQDLIYELELDRLILEDPEEDLYHLAGIAA